MIIAPGLLIAPDNVLAIDTSDLENLRIVVTTKTHEDVEVTGIQALEAVMLMKPSAFENRRMKWAKHVWSIHNLIGHPLMQILAYLRLYKTAIKIHDATVPRPKGKK
jgi:hypothetical protein